MPETATLEAVTSVAAAMTTMRVRRAFTPMVAASSSPMVRMLMRQRKANRTASPAAMGTAAIWTSAVLAPVRLPMSQYVMSASSPLAGSATSLV